VPELSWCTERRGDGNRFHRVSVACLRFTLAALGLYHATLTQKYDKPTAEAMAIFQSNNPPLRVDGLATPLVLTQMGIYSGVDAEPPPLCLARRSAGRGSKGRFGEVPAGQEIEDGTCPSTEVSGTFDKATGDGLRAFQLATPPLAPMGCRSVDPGRHGNLEWRDH
jgi:hypothetical protein